MNTVFIQTPEYQLNYINSNFLYLLVTYAVKMQIIAILDPYRLQ